MAADPVQRAEIGQMILNVCAGAHTETAMLAQTDALACVIGGIMHMSNKSLSEAEAVVDECADMIRQHLRKNWGGLEVVDQHHA